VAILRTIKHPYQTHTVLEDPVTSSTKIYFQHDAYNKGTLTALFDIGINHDIQGNGITSFGVSSPRNAGTGGLLLNGPVVGVNHTLTGTSINDNQLNLDPTNFLSMDPDRPMRHIRYDTDGVSNAVWMQTINFRPNFETLYSIRFNLTGDCSSSLPIVRTTSDALQSIWAVYLNPVTKNLVCLNQAHGSSALTPAWSHGYRFSNYFSNSPSRLIHPTNGTNRTNQFLGVSTLDAKAMFFQSDVGTDYGHYVIKYTDNDNTSTTQFQNTLAPAAGGTSAGGNRSTNFGQQTPKYSSITFDDTLSMGNSAFYTPYCDVNGKYHPMYYQWNRTTDTFTRNSNITVNWGATDQNAVWLPDSISGSSLNVNYGLQKIWYNETFTITAGSVTTRYLTFFQLHGGSVHDVEPRRRTFVTFSINPTDPTVLTYHSHVAVPSTPKNIIWLNDNRTLLGIITHNSFYTYNFNPTTGWTQTAVLPNQFWEVGKDSLGRIWALERNVTGFFNIHLVTLNVPINITVTSPASTFNYTGSPINSQLTVNAYSPTGERITADIKLVIDGGSMTFAGANLTTTVTTSTVEDTTVPITITGGGISNIVASVVL
jgi:hypothetical protein